MLTRRTAVKTALGFPLAAVLADPLLSHAAAQSTEAVSLKTPSGDEVHAALALPSSARKAGAVVLIHEWWGLNDQIRAMAVELAKEGYVALAVDLMKGQVTADPSIASAQTRNVNPQEATETLVAWINWIKTHKASTGKVVTLGWCFGGGWALNAALATPVHGAVVYYGRVPNDATKLATLKGPVLGHFATRDKWINKPMVDGFTAAMKQAGKKLTAHWYEADHAFANPTSGRYDKEDSQLAWRRTLVFLRATIGA